MVNSTFDPSIHLTVQDLQVDVEVNPSSLCICIKSSKNDLFPQGCFIYLGRALSNFGHPGIFTSLRSGPLFIDTHGRPLTRSRLSSFIQSVLQGPGIPGSFQATVFALGPLRQLRNAAFQITLSRPWAGGPVMHINSTLEPQWNQFGSFWEAASVTGTLSTVVAYTYVQVTSGLAVMGLGVSQPRAPSPSLSAMAPRSLQLGVGAHGWVVLLCQSWGHYFNLGAGCQ